jgi:SWIM zinc finger
MLFLLSQEIFADCKIFIPMNKLKPYATRTELLNEINIIGCANDIREEILNNANVYMLCCEHQNETSCEAKIIGMYSPKDKAFYIKRADLAHKCSRNDDSSLKCEISKQKYRNMRIGEIVENLVSKKYKIGYFEVFRILKAMRARRISFDNDNQNSEHSKENCSNMAMIKKNVIGSSSSDEFDCLSEFEREFKILNPRIETHYKSGQFFFKCNEYAKILRNIVEIKVYERPTGFLILGILYDPYNEPLIYSMLLTEHNKKESLDSFISYMKNDFYIIDLDCEIIDVLKSRQIGFFIKTRSVCAYLEEDIDDDPESYQYYHDCNFGDREYLNLEKKYYLRKHCPKNMFNLNNCCIVDMDFISAIVLSLPFFECLNSLIWLTSEDIKLRKPNFTDSLENRICDSVVDQIEENVENVPINNYEVDLVNKRCGCGKFQEFLVPCVHAIKKMGDCDPYYYVSNVYLKDSMLRIHNIVPVVDIRIFAYKNKQNSKKSRKVDRNSSEEQNSEQFAEF